MYVFLFLGAGGVVTQYSVQCTFLNHNEGGMVFYQVSLLSPLQCTVTQLYCRNCKRLREFEEIEVSRQSYREDCE
jgi:hypothetical protein